MVVGFRCFGFPALDFSRFRGLWFWGFKFRALGSWFEVRGSRFGVRGSKLGALGFSI